MAEGKILCVSFDRVVSDNRCAVLKEAGYTVTGTTRITEALQLLSGEKFDLIIIGHRFPTQDKYVLAVEAKQKANTPVLLVCGGSAEAEIPAAGRVYALEGTLGLLSAVTALMPTEVSGTPRAAA